MQTEWKHYPKYKMPYHLPISLAVRLAVFAGSESRCFLLHITFLHVCRLYFFFHKYNVFGCDLNRIWNGCGYVQTSARPKYHQSNFRLLNIFHNAQTIHNCFEWIHSQVEPSNRIPYEIHHFLLFLMPSLCSFLRSIFFLFSHSNQ